MKGGGAKHLSWNGQVAPAGMLGHREATPFLGEWENPETARQGFVSRARRRTIQGGAFGRDGSSGGDA